MTNEQDFTKQAEKFRERYHAVKDEIGKVIVGHDEIIHGVLTCMMIGGHCLLEGAPGLGKNRYGSRKSLCVGQTVFRIGNAKPDRARGYLSVARSSVGPIFV